MSDLLEVLAVMAGALIVVIILALGTCSAIYALMSPPTCRQTAAAMGLHSQWGFWTGCMIQDETGKYLPEDIYVATHYGDRHQLDVHNEDSK
jgi:hypothetical protein